MKRIFRNPRVLSLISLLLITPMGLYSKVYSGPGKVWFNQYLGGVLYEIFWCLLLFFIVPKKRAIAPIAVWVFIVTCALELLQLWQAPWLITIRSSVVGRYLLGTTFVWLDFPHYLLGCLIGWLWLQWIWSLGVQKY
ncbi:MAG: DUF2809 domain-containing protein [Okeania sp. SIO2D1]|nr:DUF2809 domain-containing protein [Okeania sp. SIO2D1]